MGEYRFRYILFRRQAQGLKYEWIGEANCHDDTYSSV